MSINRVSPGVVLVLLFVKVTMASPVHAHPPACHGSGRVVRFSSPCWRDPGGFPLSVLGPLPAKLPHKQSPPQLELEVLFSRQIWEQKQ